MGLCSLYLKNYKKHAFKCLFDKSNTQAFKLHKESNVFYDCSRCKQCHDDLNLPYRIFADANIVINKFKDKVELVKYKENFSILDDSLNLNANCKFYDDAELGRLIIPMDNIRDFQLIDNLRISKSSSKNFVFIDDPELGELLVPRHDHVRDYNLYLSQFRAAKRALDTYYGYALCNEWKYFATFTVSSEKCNRYDDKAVKLLWDIMLKRLRRFDKNIKVLCVPERHQDGALHFHALIWSDKDLPLTPYEYKGVPQYSKTGAILFTNDFWDFGICTYALLPPDGNYEACINYLVAYVTKQKHNGYGCKRYSRTHNLDTKEKICQYADDAFISAFVGENNLHVYKETDAMIVYRSFGLIDETKQVSTTLPTKYAERVIPPEEPTFFKGLKIIYEPNEYGTMQKIVYIPEHMWDDIIVLQWEFRYKCFCRKVTATQISMF